MTSNLKYRLFKALTAVACICMALMPFVGKAETVSQKDAMRIAGTFFNAINGNVMSEPKMVYNGRKLTTGRLFSPYYVYNHPTGGFVVVSADNKAFPILAYSRTDRFDPNKMSPELKALMELYARHIEMIRYDSRIPVEAIKAWSDIRGYIASMLAAPYEATDVLIDADQREETLDRMLAADNIDDLVSAVYTPQQWEEMIDVQLTESRNVLLGVISPSNVFPLVIQGRKGDMYRISFPSLPTSLFRLLPTEYLSQGEVADISRPLGAPREDMEEAPFAFYDGFIAEIDRENREASRGVEETLIPSEPVVYPSGSGFFTVKIPGSPVSARIYNVGGSLVKAHKYRDAGNTVYLDVSHEPIGFYFAIIFDEAGNSYGVKIYK